MVSGPTFDSYPCSQSLAVYIVAKVIIAGKKNQINGRDRKRKEWQQTALALIGGHAVTY